MHVFAHDCKGIRPHVWAPLYTPQHTRPGYAKHAHGWRVVVHTQSGAVAVTADGDRVLLLLPDDHGVLQQPGVVYCATQHRNDIEADASLPDAVYFAAACFTSALLWLVGGGCVVGCVRSRCVLCSWCVVGDVQYTLLF